MMPDDLATATRVEANAPPADHLAQDIPELIAECEHLTRFFADMRARLAVLESIDCERRAHGRVTALEVRISARADGVPRARSRAFHVTDAEFARVIAHLERAEKIFLLTGG